MKSYFFVKVKPIGLFVFFAIMVLYSSFVFTQGRVLTRATQFDDGGLRGGDYLKIPELIVFEGTWRWKSAAGDSIFTMELWRYKLVPPADLKTRLFSYDAIAGHYNLTVNGILVSSNYNRRTDPRFPSLSGSDMNDDGIDVLRIGFTDFEKNKRAHGRFELFRENPDKARWSMSNMETVVITPDMVWHRGFSLPNNVVMHRVAPGTEPPAPPPGVDLQ
ncbi:MAG TPA: hypothetical protein DCM62_10270 [Bacteroidales bacterium]|nr:hypothetical protein [Bacteroidales bacterium]